MRSAELQVTGRSSIVQKIPNQHSFMWSEITNTSRDKAIVEFIVFMGRLANLLTAGSLMEGDDRPCIIERTILSRVPEGKQIDTDEYETLLLDGISCPDIFEKDKLFLEKFTSCVHLSFNACSMKSLKNFPTMPKLVKLELQDNKLQSGLEFVVERCPNLEIIKLTNNYLTSLSELKKLLKLGSNLRQLDLMGNPVCEMTNYTQVIFQALPYLDILDGQDREGNEIMSDEEEANDDQDLDDYGDEQDMVADGVLKEKGDGTRKRRKKRKEGEGEEEGDDDSVGKVSGPSDDDDDEDEEEEKGEEEETKVEDDEEEKDAVKSESDSENNGSSSSSSNSSSDDSQRSSSKSGSSQSSLSDHEEKKRVKIKSGTVGVELSSDEEATVITRGEVDIINIGKKRALALKEQVMKGKYFEDQKRYKFN